MNCKIDLLLWIIAHCVCRTHVGLLVNLYLNCCCCLEVFLSIYYFASI